MTHEITTTTNGNNGMITSDARLNVNDILVVAVSRAEAKMKSHLAALEKELKEVKEAGDTARKNIKSGIVELVKNQFFATNPNFEALRQAVISLLQTCQLTESRGDLALDKPDFLSWTAADTWLYNLHNLENLDETAHRMSAAKSLEVRVRMLDLPTSRGGKRAPEMVRLFNLAKYDEGKAILAAAEELKESLLRKAELTEQLLEWKKKLAQIPALERQYRAKLVEQALGSSYEGRAILEAMTADLDARIDSL